MYLPFEVFKHITDVLAIADFTSGKTEGEREGDCNLSYPQACSRMRLIYKLALPSKLLSLLIIPTARFLNTKPGGKKCKTSEMSTYKTKNKFNIKLFTNNRDRSPF